MRRGHIARPHIGKVPMKFYFRAQDISITLPGLDVQGKLVLVWKVCVLCVECLCVSSVCVSSGLCVPSLCVCASLRVRHALRHRQRISVPCPRLGVWKSSLARDRPTHPQLSST